MQRVACCAALHTAAPVNSRSWLLHGFGLSASAAHRAALAPGQVMVGSAYFGHALLVELLLTGLPWR